MNRCRRFGGWVETFEDITERRQAEDKIAHMARHDGLTGLPNRTHFGEHLENALGSLGRDDSIAVLCLDLDRFKVVNDTLGHQSGDRLLQIAAERLRGTLREPTSSPASAATNSRSCRSLERSAGRGDGLGAPPCRA